MNAEHAQVGRRFQLRWLLASTVVLAFGVIVGGVGILIGASNGEVEAVLVVAVVGASAGRHVDT